MDPTSEAFRKTVLDALKSGDGIAALGYADYLEERDESCPEFFRLLGRKAMGVETEWEVVTGTATYLGGGYWSIGTAANRFVGKTLTAVVMKTHRRESAGDMWLGLSPRVADSMSRSQELRDAIYNGNTPVGPRQTRTWHRYGIPPWLYGMKTWVFDDGDIPDDWAVIVNEGRRIMGVITECVP